MNLVGLKRHLRSVYPVLPLERLVSRHLRHLLRKLSNLIIVILVILIVAVWLRPGLDWPLWSLIGATLILLAFRLKLFLLEAFFSSSYFRAAPALADFETALLIYSLDEKDVTASFLATTLGRELIRRVGVTPAALRSFLKTRTSRLVLAQYVVEPAVAGEMITLADLARTWSETDKEFGQFLFAQGVQTADLMATADWLTRATAARKTREQWWSRDYLGRIPGLASDWSYGRAFNLGKYGQQL